MLVASVPTKTESYLPGRGGVEVGMQDEPPQSFTDVLRLTTTLRALPVQDPTSQAIRDDLLRKLTRLAQTPGQFRGGPPVGVKGPTDR